MALEGDPSKPKCLKCFLVRTHSRLNSTMQSLTPCDATEEEMFILEIDGVQLEARVVHVALEGTLSNADCAATASLRGGEAVFY